MGKGAEPLREISSNSKENEMSVDKSLIEVNDNLEAALDTFCDDVRNGFLNSLEKGLAIMKLTEPERHANCAMKIKAVFGALSDVAERHLD